MGKNENISSEMTSVYFLHSYSIQSSKSLATAIMQEKEIKKEKVKLSLFSNDRILYLKDSKDSMRNLLDLIIPA